MSRAEAVILFDADPATKAHDPITTNGSVEAKGGKRSPGGGVVLWITGTLDGANVTLEGNPGSGWAAADTCAAVAAVGVCRAAVGPVDLRVTVASAGASTSITVTGYEVQAVVASAAAAGGGPVSFGDVTSGTNPNALLVSGSFAHTGGGTVTANALATAALDALAEIADTLCADGQSLVKAAGTWTCGTAGGAVDSVFARTGAVVATSGDYSCSQVTGCVTSAAPGTHATQHQHGGADEIATATAAANAIPKAGAGATLASAWLPIVPASLGGWGANVSALDCSGNANGGAITTSAPGVFGCSDDDGASSLAFSALTTATNTAATMTVGSGAALRPSGSGDVQATSAAALAAPADLSQNVVTLENDAQGRTLRVFSDTSGQTDPTFQVTDSASAEAFGVEGGQVWMRPTTTTDGTGPGIRWRNGTSQTNWYMGVWDHGSGGVVFRRGGNTYVNISAVGLDLGAPDNPRLRWDVAASLTAETVRPRRDNAYGMGGSSTIGSMVHSAVSVAQWTADRWRAQIALQIAGRATPPYTCDASAAGSSYYDTDINLRCTCNGTNWLQDNDWSTTCS